MEFQSSRMVKAAEAAAASGALAGAPGLNNGAAPHPANPISGIFGSGRVRFYTATQNFVVPANCTRVRSRLFAPGGSFPSTAGGTVSFGTHHSATGGTLGTVDNPGVGGTGIGGDVNHAGAPGLPTAAGTRGGGGGASLLGPADRGGAGSGGRPGFKGKAGKPVIINVNTNSPTVVSATDGEHGDADSIDFINTGGGGYSAGTNATLLNNGSAGANGGGGGGGSGSTTTGGKGGFPGGGDGGRIDGPFGCGGGGFSLKDNTGLVPGSSIPMTIPDGGLIIVEW